MRATCAAIILAMALGGAVSGEPRRLFNGKNLDGWKSIPRYPGQPAGDFVVENGVLMTGTQKGTLWYTGEKIGNARIRVVYKLANGQGNSGIFIRIPKEPQSEEDCIHGGWEVQIDDGADEWHRTGSLYSMTKSLSQAAKPAGEWNTLDITLNGQRTTVHLNGILASEYDGVAPAPERKRSSEPVRGPRPDSGYIAIQNHDNRSVVSFREISVEPLPAR
jgi:hypothetical protein